MSAMEDRPARIEDDKAAVRRMLEIGRGRA